MLDRKAPQPCATRATSLRSNICRDATCEAADWASAVPGERVIRLCNPFWNAARVSQQGATIMHEALHLWWDQIDDQGCVV